jgi:chloramphenicol-sensitive protein RarD
VVEVSLGYFINPLVSVLLGVLVLRERLRRPQWVAVGIGAAAGAGAGRRVRPAAVAGPARGVQLRPVRLVKKRQGLPAAEGMFVETAVLVPVALGYVAFLMASGDATVGHVSAGHTALIMLAGVLTALPLISFADAANRVPADGVGRAAVHRADHADWRSGCWCSTSRCRPAASRRSRWCGWRWPCSRGTACARAAPAAGGEVRGGR